jgi:hypothetical protein
LLRWLEPENHEKSVQPDRPELIKQIHQLAKAGELRQQIAAIAKSRTAGIWRIKRAKIILGTLEGKSVQWMVTAVRVPPESIIRCQESFAEQGMNFFKTPGRLPTSREAGVETLINFLENPSPQGSSRWDLVSVHYIGHDFSAKQIQQIRELIARQAESNPTEIGRQVCRLFELYQSDGNYKLTQVKDILKRMDMDNVISLPPVRHRPKSKGRPAKKANASEVSTLLTQRASCLKTHDIRNLQLIPVSSKKDSHLWREMIERFHYIKTTRLFGAQIRYLVYGDPVLPGTLNFLKSSGGMENTHWASRYNTVKRGKHLLGALGFAAASWRLSSRDGFIGWSDAQRETNLKLVVNNVRFLILPWNRLKNLASRILGATAKQLPVDWEGRYNYRPVLLETFVQLDRFKGTCYKAANWIPIGTTEGYSLVAEYKKSVSPKGIFVYPLSRNFREQLNHPDKRIRDPLPFSDPPAAIV